jgi:hypothetical protein
MVRGSWRAASNWRVQEPAVIERLIIEVQVLELIAVGIRAKYGIFVA